MPTPDDVPVDPKTEFTPESPATLSSVMLTLTPAAQLKSKWNDVKPAVFPALASDRTVTVGRITVWFADSVEIEHVTVRS